MSKKSALIVLTLIVTGALLFGGCHLLPFGESAGPPPTKQPATPSTPKPPPNPPSPDGSVIRGMPLQVARGQTFRVTVLFISPDDDFHAIGLTDFAPDGWEVTVDKSWCTPESNAAKVTDNKAEIAWFGPYARDTRFQAQYEVTVPRLARQGGYTFGDGSLMYSVGGLGSAMAGVGGQIEVKVVS